MVLRAEHLSVRYGPIAGVKDVSFECHPGELVTLVGPNGAGKSSTLNAIAGALDAAVSGSITLDGQLLLGLSPENIVRRGVSLVPEGRGIFATLTVNENLRLGAAHLKKRGWVEEEVARLAQRFPAVDECINLPAGVLSGGQQQQLAIARALLARPRFLLLDEPSLGLAPLIVEQMFSLIAALRDDGIGIVLVEQYARRAMEISDRSYLLRDGVVFQDFDPRGEEDILNAYFAVESEH